MRHAISRVRCSQTGDIDQVGNHGRGRRLRARPLAVVKRGADGIALYQHRVHRAFDVGNQAFGRNERRMDAQFNTLRRAFGDAQ